MDRQVEANRTEQRRKLKSKKSRPLVVERSTFLVDIVYALNKGLLVLSSYLNNSS